MPLRPVSELGLVDITDVPARGQTASGRASTQRKRPAEGRASKQVTGTPELSATGKSRSAGPAKRDQRSQSPAARTPKVAGKAPATSARSAGKAKPRSTRESTATTSPRSAATRTPKPSNGSTAAPRGATPVRRRTSEGVRTTTNPASRAPQRSRNAREPGQTKRSSAAKTRISVLMGAGLIAGGFLVARAALQR